MSKVEPGLYWAKRIGDNFVLPVRVTDYGTVAALLPASTADPVTVYDFGPRIPTVRELQEQAQWTDEPRCPRCGGPTSFYADSASALWAYCEGGCEDIHIEVKAKFQTSAYEGD